MTSQPLISVIVPVYNAERYLEQCLESILNQTYENLEIICVNDGSSDDSIHILNQYKNKDERIIIIDKKNEGVSATRNIGLQKAQGDYVMFVDADDWIDINTCKNAVDAMQINEADVVMWSYVSEHESGQFYKKIFSNDIIFEREEVKNKIHRRLIGICGEELAHPELADSLCTVWGKLYKKELILENSIFFIDLSKIGTYEDGMFNLELFYYVKRAVYLNNNSYHYRKENTTSLTSRYRQNLYWQWQNLFQIMQEYINEKKMPYIYNVALSNRIALSILGLGLNELENEVSSVEKIKTIKKILSEEHYSAAYKKLNLQYFPIHWRLFYGCAKQKNAVGVYLLLIGIKKIIT